MYSVAFFDLFHSDRFGEIPGFIHITAALDCLVVGNQLHGNGSGEGHELVGCFRQIDPEVIGIRMLRFHFSRQISRVLAPRALTSFMLLTVLGSTACWVARAITGIPSVISEIGPCLSSPAA